MMMMIMMMMMIRASSRRAYLAQLHAFIITRRYLTERGVCVLYHSVAEKKRNGAIDTSLAPGS